MSQESSNDLIVKSAPHITGEMSKNRLMLYTFSALLIITAVTAIFWSAEKTPDGWNLGLTLAINALIAVGIAVGLDALLFKITAKSPLNTLSAAVFGLVVADIYVLGVPGMATVELFPLEAPQCFIYVAAISIIGLIVFKKIVGLSGRKYVNPAAAAKLVVMIPFVNTLLIAIDHLKSSALGVPSLAGPIGLTNSIHNNGLTGFGYYVINCFSNPTLKAPAATMNNLIQVMFLSKFHGWPGGACTIAVLVVGIGFLIVARKYVKWKVTASYFIAVAIMSLILSFAYGDSDLTTRLLFELFIGSSIFLGFFMVTDPQTSPLTSTGQIIFGIGVGVLTVLMQTYMQFFGASFVALVIMNLTVPLLDRVGIHKPFGR